MGPCNIIREKPKAKFVARAPWRRGCFIFIPEGTLEIGRIFIYLLFYKLRKLLKIKIKIPETQICGSKMIDMNLGLDPRHLIEHGSLETDPFVSMHVNY